MNNLKYNLLFKTSLIVVIALLLLIPSFMIEELIYERENTQREAVLEVSSIWSNEQTITGPILSVPFNRYIEQYSTKDSVEKIVQIRDHIHFLPDILNVEGAVMPEKRYRGIYEVVVYNSNIHFSGSFYSIDFKSFDIPINDLLLDKAFVTIGINDLRGIEKQIELNWNDESISFTPGTVTNDIVSSGINAEVKIDMNKQTSYVFSFDLDLKGSQLLHFIPVGKVTDINLKSEWNNPSFNGAFLPDSRVIDENGFTAHWNILHLNRNFPQSWIGSSQSVSNSAFGVDLLLPVDNYQKSTRTIKYAILFIVLTFMVFFFVEILNKKFIHPIQYILVGLALIIFFSLLLAISEHMKFNYAFIISAVSTLLLVTAYVKSILKSNTLSILISAILAILYSFIFVIIQLQDYALLIGSIGLFIILGLVMYFSRKIDWYNINLEENN
ncbi:MAG: cell envelope integrity protein CreD [Bacteroidales bacterium]|jgi:inner membrane protein|nr:cell envelope integrity protein CreD [Bacteroidales bacterium]